MKQLSANQFPDLYKSLGIDLNKLGCVMLDLVDPIDMPLSYTFQPEAFYTAKNPAHFWINGYAGDKNPHMTLLYGLLTPAYEQALNVAEVMEDWSVSTVTIKDVGYFPSPLEDEEYYCIVGMIEVTPKLLEGSQRLEFLPHINTFAVYKPHVTIAYIRKDDALRDRMIEDFRALFAGKEFRVSPGLNLGGEIKEISRG